MDGDVFGDAVMNISLTHACLSTTDGEVGLSISGVALRQFAKTRLVIFDRNVNANTYVNNVIQPVVIPFLNGQFRRGGGTLQQGRSPGAYRLIN